MLFRSLDQFGFLGIQDLGTHTAKNRDKRRNKVGLGAHLKRRPLYDLADRSAYALRRFEDFGSCAQNRRSGAGYCCCCLCGLTFEPLYSSDQTTFGSKTKPVPLMLYSLTQAMEYETREGGVPHSRPLKPLFLLCNQDRSRVNHHFIT